MSTSERTLPHSLEAEKAVLGAILLHPSALATAAGKLNPGDFFRSAHEHLFRALLTLERAGTAIELVTVAEELKRVQRLDDVGGLGYIASLVDGMPRSANVEHYAAIVLDRSKLRATITIAQTVADEAYEAAEAASAILGRAEARLFQITAGNGKQTGFRRLADIIPDVMEQVERWHAAPGAVSGVPSGLVDLDAMLRGFQPNTLNVIAARPSMGKSSLVENIARHAAKQGFVCGVFSLEMADEEYAVRALAAEAKVDSHRMQSGRLHQTDYGRMSQAIGGLSELPLFVSDDPYVTARDVRAQARRLREQEGRLDLIAVDYTQLMLSEDKAENRAIEVGNITRALKGLAKELSIPVLALAQLNRELEKRDDKHPRLSDLRDSGRIEEDADVVLFIYRDDHYNRESQKPGVAELMIAKHRNGPIGTVEVTWQKEFTRFENLAPVPAEDRMLPMGDR